jgi:hypothetical protein
MSDPGTTKQTAGAQRAMGLATLVNKVFASERVKSSKPGHPGYRLEMRGPEGPSTSELRKVEDRLQLVPLSTAQGEVSILIGSADPGMSQAELRGFDRLRVDHQRAWSDDLPLDRADYERVLARIAAFFDQQGVPVTIKEGVVPSAAPQVAARRSPLPWILAAVLLVAAIVAAAYARRP